MSVIFWRLHAPSSDPSERFCFGGRDKETPDALDALLGKFFQNWTDAFRHERSSCGNMGRAICPVATCPLE